MSAAVSKCAALAIVFLVQIAIVPAISAQPPGTRPPSETLPTPESAAPPPVEGFLFLDESRNPVMMPRMTFEEIERLRNIEAGVDTRAQLYAFDSLEIDGMTEEGRCELDVTLRLSVDATFGGWTAIPLKMNNFHRLGPADITGLDEHRMTVAADGSGYVLWAKSNQTRDVLVKMRVVARVAGAPARSIDFVLPDVPSTIRLVTAQGNVTGEVVGRGDEVVQTEPVVGGRTRLVVESGGGTCTLKWGSANRASDTAPVVEVESMVTIDWDSPQDLPLASVQMTIRNLRGVLSSFDIRLPANSELLDTPNVASSTSAIEFSTPIPEPEGDRIQLFIPDSEREQRIDLSFDLQLSSNETSANDPLQLQVPSVIGALRQRGEILVRTESDFRLRWRTRPWVQSLLKTPVDVSSTNRSYSFRYDRPTFTLPLWLSAKQRQLRLTSETQVSLLEGLASLEMTIYATGQSSDGRGVQLDLADWQLRSIVDLETGKQLDSYAADQYSEIEMGSRVGDDPSPIRIRAERQLPSDSTNVAFSLPQIVKNDDSLLVQSASLQIRSDGRRSLVVDLDQSTGLDPVSDANDSDLAEPTLSRFRVLPPDAPAHVVGMLVDQPSRITLAAETQVDLDGNLLTTSVDWTVSSLLSLEGRLPIQFTAPQSVASPNPNLPVDSSAAGAIALSSPSSSTVGNEPEVSIDQWTVKVDGAAATLAALDDGRYEIISDRLLDGTMSVRLRHVQSILRDESAATQMINLPRPAIPDVSIIGAMKIRLRGDATSDLTSAGSSIATEDINGGGVHVVELESLPREPLQLRLRPRSTSDMLRALTVRRAVLRTAIGRSTRHEELMATVDGGNSLSITLPPEVNEVDVEASVDGAEVLVERGQRALRIPIPTSDGSHQVRVRIWVKQSTPVSLSTIKPMMGLPAAVERLYWQIIAPSDSHVIWASPTAGRAMAWDFDRWRLSRKSALSDQRLNEWSGDGDEPTQYAGAGYLHIGTDSNNRYLYVGSDVNSFEVVMISRGLLWLVTGAVILAASTLLIYLPVLRHPLTAIVAAIGVAGLLVVAPDAAVLVGQLGMIASLLVIIMVAIRTLIAPRPNVRVLSSTRSSGARREPSTRTYIRPAELAPKELSETQAIPPPQAPTEVSS